MNKRLHGQDQIQLGKFDKLASHDNHGFSRDGSGQAHSTVKMPVHKEANTSIRLLILYDVPIVNK